MLKATVTELGDTVTQTAFVDYMSLSCCERALTMTF